VFWSRSLKGTSDEQESAHDGGCGLPGPPGGRGGWGGGGYYGGGGWGRGYGDGWGRGYGYYGGGIYLGTGYGGYYGGPYYGDGGYYYDNPGVIVGGAPLYSGVYTTPGVVTQPMAGPVMTSDPTGLPANGTVAQANGAVGRQAFYSGPAASQAVVRVKTMGPDAQVWINGTPMGTSQSGEQVFTFHSPSAGSNYVIREAWTENGKQMSREQQVTLQPGQTIVADFTKTDANEPRRNGNQPLQNTQNNEQQNGQRDSSTQPPANPIPKPAVQPFNSDAKPKLEVK
jgi:hypothetical protein